MVVDAEGNTVAFQAGRKRRVLLIVALSAFGLALISLIGALATSSWWTWALAIGCIVLGAGYLWLRRGVGNANGASRR